MSMSLFPYFWVNIVFTTPQAYGSKALMLSPRSFLYTLNNCQLQQPKPFNSNCLKADQAALGKLMLLVNRYLSNNFFSFYIYKISLLLLILYPHRRDRYVETVTDSFGKIWATKNIGILVPDSYRVYSSRRGNNQGLQKYRIKDHCPNHDSISV